MVVWAQTDLTCRGVKSTSTSYRAVGTWASLPSLCFLGVGMKLQVNLNSVCLVGRLHS